MANYILMCLRIRYNFNPSSIDSQDQKCSLLFPIVLGSVRLNINNHIYQDNGVFLHIGISYIILYLSENI
jgi:hypothetical protein